jgi:hypothetical protein
VCICDHNHRYLEARNQLSQRRRTSRAAEAKKLRLKSKRRIQSNYCKPIPNVRTAQDRLFFITFPSSSSCQRFIYRRDGFVLVSITECIYLVLDSVICGMRRCGPCLGCRTRVVRPRGMKRIRSHPSFRPRTHASGPQRAGAPG